jgi:outer membrane protein assembly factor BamA
MTLFPSPLRALFAALLCLGGLAAGPARAQDPDLGDPAQAGPALPPVAQTDSDDPGKAILAAAQPFAGRTLESVAVECDDPETCGPERQPLFMSLVRLELGKPVSPAQVVEAWSRLTRTEAFRALGVHFTPASAEGNGVRLVFKGLAQALITSVDVEYADAASRWYPKQFDTQIKKRILLRKGGNYPIDHPEQIERQVANVMELYERLGYRGTEVRIEPEYEDARRTRVRVVVHVKEGDQDPIGGVLLQGNANKSYTEALEPVETGERVDFWQDFFRFVGIGTYERRRFREQLKTLEQQYRDEGWFSARVRLEDVLRRDGKVWPLVRVQEGPRVELTFEGNESISDDALRAATTFIGSGAIDDTELEGSKAAIVQAYQALGHYYVQVAMRRVKVDATGTRQRIIFHIDEGPQVYVRTVRFEGNRKLSDARLQRAMETQGIGADRVIGAFDASRAVLQDARLANDLTAIRDLYRLRGYAGIRFRCMPEGQDPGVWEALGRLKPAEDAHDRLRGRFDVWSDDPAQARCFRVDRDRDSRVVDVVVELDEGPRTTVNRVEMREILRRMPPSMQDDAYELLQKLGFTDPQRNWRRRIGLNRQQIVSLEGFILRFYRGQGFTRAVVVAHCADDPKEPHPGPPPRTRSTTSAGPGGLPQVVGEAPDETCSEAALYGRKVDHINFRVRKGPKTIVEGILIRGNLQTSERTIRKELLFREGQPLATDDLFLSQSNLRSLGLFESVKVETIGASEAGADSPDAQADADDAADDISPVVVKVNVEESSRFQIQGSFGLSVESSPLTTDTLPLLFVLGTTLRDRNLLRWGLEGRLTAKHANRLTNPTAFYGDESRWEFGPGVTDRRFLSTRIVGSLDGTAQGGLTDQRDLYERRADLTGTLSYDFSNLSYPSDWGRGMLGSFKTTYGRKQLRELTRRNQIPEFGDPVNELKFQPQFTIDKRDNPLHPTRGLLAALDSEARFNSNALVPSLYEPALKETLTTQYVQSFLERRLILVPTLRLGAAQTRDVADERLRDFLFKAGGDAVTHPVRGYADASIDACDGHYKRRGCSSAVDPTDDRILRTVGGRAYVGGSFEARFPTFVFDDFWFAAFADVGAVAPTWSDLATSGWDRFYPSAGGGLRWLVTGQIPLRLDVGMPLRATVFSRAEPRLHLNIFYQL